MNNTPKPRGTYADYLLGETEDKIFIFELSKNNKDNQQVVGADTGRPVMFPLTYPIPMIGTIYDPEGNFPRKIRFVDGEKSIYVDEQTPDDKFPKTRVIASFVNGRVTVDGRDITKLKFMMEWDINGTKKNRNEKKEAAFFLVDTSKTMAKVRTASKAKFSAEQWCYDTDLDKVLAVASIKLNSEQMVQNAEDIRYNLALIAGRQPEEFLKMLEDPKTERRYYIKKSIDKGFVSINSSINAVCWSDNLNAPLTVAPAGKDALEDFISKSFSGDGEKYFNAIKEMVEPTKVIKEAVTSKVEAPKQQVFEKPVITKEGKSDVDLRFIVKKGLEAGLITVNWNKTHWKFKDENFRGENGFIQALKDSPIMLEVLEKELAKAEKEKVE